MDPVSSELREAEAAIDSYYEANSLVFRQFGEASWYALAYYENLALAEFLGGAGQSIHEAFATTDYIINHIQYPLYWLHRSCPSGGSVPASLDDSLLQSAQDLAEIAHGYEPFVSAYTYASRGVVKLVIKGTRISLSSPFYSDSRYDAYDRLVRNKPLAPDQSKGNIVELIRKNLTVRESTFDYKLSRRFVEKCQRILEPMTGFFFELPNNWEFPRYSIREFRSVARFLTTRGHIHFIAHVEFAMKATHNRGILSSLMLVDIDQLKWEFARYAGVSFDVADALIEDLTYGSRGIRHPDPALQPLIPTSSNQFILMPYLLAYSNFERNLIVLMNRLPSERASYLDLVDHKENLMRDRAMEELTPSEFRFFTGRLPGRSELPDIDLALIKDDEKSVLLLELKWFIEPAEPREVLEKSEEIAKGLRQLELLAQVWRESPSLLIENLRIDSDYRILFAVASQNSIGDEHSQHPDFPVIRFDHLLDRINIEESLRLVIEWLAKRSYLPTEGVDYDVVDVVHKVGDWELEWVAIRSLATDPIA